MASEGLLSLLNDAREACTRGGKNKHAETLRYLRVARAMYPQELETWTTYIDLQIENWYKQIKTIPTAVELEEIESAISHIETDFQDSALANVYRLKMEQFWEEAAAGVREETGWCIGGAAIVNSDIEINYDYEMRYWKEKVKSAAFRQLIKEAENNAALLNRAGYVYEFDEYEWTENPYRAYGKPVLAFPHEVLLQDNTGRIQCKYDDGVKAALAAAKKKLDAQQPKAAPKAPAPEVPSRRKKTLTLVETLALPITLAKKVLQEKFSGSDIDRLLAETTLFDEYKGPFTNNVPAKHRFDDVVTANCYTDNKLPDGMHLITYRLDYLEKYKMGVYVRVLTSPMKKMFKYRHCSRGHKLSLRGQLDLTVSGPMLIQTVDGHSEHVNLAVVVTVIDI